MGFVYDQRTLDGLLAGFVGENNINLLKGALIKTGSIIAGSIVLQSMLPSTDTQCGWNDADLDIYTRSSSLHAMKDIIALMGLRPYHMVVSDAYRQGGCKLSEYKQRHQSVSYLNREKTIQLINVGDGIEVWKPLERVDFTILANYYDGNRVRSLYPLHVVSKYAVAIDVSFLRPQRIFKYYRRGFEIRFYQPDKLLNTRNSVFYDLSQITR